MYLVIQIPQNASESLSEVGFFFNPLHPLFGKSVAFCHLGRCKTGISTD